MVMITGTAYRLVARSGGFQPAGTEMEVAVDSAAWLLPGEGDRVAEVEVEVEVVGVAEVVGMVEVDTPSRSWTREAEADALEGVEVEVDECRIDD